MKKDRRDILDGKSTMQKNKTKQKTGAGLHKIQRKGELDNTAGNVAWSQIREVFNCQGYERRLPLVVRGKEFKYTF